MNYIKKPVMNDMVVKKRSAEAGMSFLKPPKEPKKERFYEFKKTKSKKTDRHNIIKGTIKPSRFLKVIITAALFVIFVAGAFLVDYFSGVRIDVIPRQEFFSVDNYFKAALYDAGALSLETVYLEEKGEMSVNASGLQQISERSSGQIIIYNVYSSQEQILVRRTRFETPEGKIYRIAESIRVPGAKIEGGEIKPSSVEVTVFADETGESYNIGLADFTIPGFKGTDKYEKFYARSKTPMAGGFDGVAKTATESDIKNLEDALKSEISGKLLSRVKEKLPDGFVMPENAVRTLVKESSFSAGAGDRADSVTAQMTIGLEGFAVRYSDVERLLVERYIASEPLGSVKIVNLEELKYNAESMDFENKNMTINIKGQVRAAWIFDEDGLINDLIKSSRKDRKEVFSRYINIDRAQLVFYPSWWRVFPKEKAKIKINTLFSTVFP